MPGDTIALGTPIFTPYLEMTHLEDYALDVVHIKAPQENKFQYTDAEIDKLLDPKIKAFFVVNPGNPTGMALSPETIGKITRLVSDKRPDLMVLTDDVYGTFVHDFRSLMAELPHNTIGVYSFSKYFGCTGWRLGAIAIHEDNIFDTAITKLPPEVTADLDRRYGPLTLEPRKLRFIDRIVADSRDIALNHTAGLSLPQQVMMSLFSLAELMDETKVYQDACMEIVNRRAWSMIEGLGLQLTPNPNYDAYYGLIDFEFWARKNIGEEAVAYLKRNVHPLDLAFRLAEVHGIVLLNGGGFEAPDWSLRVSLANLPDEAYADIGRGVRAVARGYRDAYEAAMRATKANVQAAEPVPPSDRLDPPGTGAAPVPGLSIASQGRTGMVEALTMALVDGAKAAIGFPTARDRPFPGSRRARRVLAAALLCLGAQGAAARTIYVTPSGSGPGYGADGRMVTPRRRPSRPRRCGA